MVCTTLGSGPSWITSTSLESSPATKSMVLSVEMAICRGPVPGGTWIYCFNVKQSLYQIILSSPKSATNTDEPSSVHRLLWMWLLSWRTG